MDIEAIDIKQLEKHVEGLRQALLDGDREAARVHREWLTAVTSSALLEQDREAMRALRGPFARLAPLADKHAPERAGERWRALGEMLMFCDDCEKPMEQARLADLGRLSGKILKEIAKKPGITPSELGSTLDKSASHISNELKILSNEGMIHRIPMGKSIKLYLAVNKQDVSERFAPLRTLAELVGYPEDVLSQIQVRTEATAKFREKLVSPDVHEELSERKFDGIKSDPISYVFPINSAAPNLLGAHILAGAGC